ncbi:hypothetical protein E5161_12530 [Cohnella pontilimi]|uniref:Uncharacterized protein n=1 Tax=Cohnella pontilimi TaxID=2564100 RepID=A0A4U0FBE2_9BACL|nr:hypothetical protein [Cohnella pontilimi]TJY42011.1 hypothetical protein E5161_12530 [Cohnella pontilimi]
MDHPQSARRIRAYMNPYGVTRLHLRNPWVIAFFSFSFPGFGHLLLERYLPAIILAGWEIFINTKANVNSGILYSLLGDFDKAKEVLDSKWLLLYVGIYMFTIWDSYRKTVDLNKQYILADREDAWMPHMRISALDINYMDKRNPLLALVWSVLAPGLGHLYVHKIVTGFLVFAFTVALIFQSHLLPAIHQTFVGDFEGARALLDMQWTLYLPSMYSFIFYDAYVTAVEDNVLFEKEQSQFLRTQYQHPSFPIPEQDR